MYNTCIIQTDIVAFLSRNICKILFCDLLNKAFVLFCNQGLRHVMLLKSYKLSPIKLPQTYRSLDSRVFNENLRVYIASREYLTFEK